MSRNSTPVSVQMLAQRFELPPGASVGKYEIVRKIAAGGMAEIYLARARGTAGFEKLVVLKRILPHVAADPSFVRMFLDEARLAATLQHPNIADVYDVGEADGAYFFTMEFIHGQDVRAIRIAERVREQRVPLAIAVAIVHGTIAGLDYAHAKAGPDGRPLGLVHRDVSSSNVLVSYDGAVKLVDFGIARATASEHKTRTGTLKGKIPYMSPEQAKGQALDRRSDLFSLGVVLYELTVGRRPFRGESDFIILEKIVHHGATPPSQVVAGYPPDLEAIVMKLLAREPAHRYASGEEVLHALEEFAANNQLWLSANAIGKYMRALFAKQIAAWHAAEQHGSALDDQMADAMLAQSSSELLTPITAFPALSSAGSDGSADDDDNDDATADRLYSVSDGGRRMPTAITAPALLVPAAPPPLPVAPRSRRLWWILSVALLASAAGIGGYVVVTQPAAVAPARSAPPVEQQPSVPPPAVVVAPPPAAVVAPPVPPAPLPAVVAPPVVAAPAPPPSPVVVVPKHPAAPPRPGKAAHPTAKPPAGSAAGTWDANSPYLPGQP